MVFQYPGWARWYKKPAYVDITQLAIELHNYQEAMASKSDSTATPSAKIASKKKKSKDGIPHELRLERVLKNQTCKLHLLDSLTQCSTIADPKQVAQCLSMTSTCS